jgi:hypothetical protein
MAPTAAGVSVTGRVTAPDGSGLRNAKVTLADQSGNRRYAMTGSFGYFHFDDVTAGETYIISVVSKRYWYSPRLIQVFDNLTDVDFVGQE